MEAYDLLLITDATYSMVDYLNALNTSIPQIISISALTGCFSRVGLLAYRDYSDANLLEWSGWLDQSINADENQPDLLQLAKTLEPLGGGDYPEATKTALAKAYEVMRPEAKTVILFYTDAPPHTAWTRSGWGHTTSNGVKEQKALLHPETYGGFGSSFEDWVSACNQLRRGEKKAQVFCILEPSMDWQHAGYYAYLCTITGGTCIHLKDSKPASISRVSIEVLLAWMGVERRSDGSNNANDAALPAVLCRYMSIANIKKLKDENDSLGSPFFTTPSSGGNKGILIKQNVTKLTVTSDNLKKYLPKKVTPVADFAKSWASDPAYQRLAVKHLKQIITNDVRAIALNPIFGSLWRVICSDRKHEARNELVDAFGSQVEKVDNAEDKASLKAWLEESYDYTAEVLEIIDSVPEKDRFPCVFLDPTISYADVDAASQADDEDDQNRPITSFTRAELLEIGRSCDPKILRRLGRILTRLTYVKSAADLPAHIATTIDEDVPKIPMVLATNEYKRQFWRILLHVVVPGTMLSARTAALLAALSLRLGVTPLTKAADREMLSFRNRWNDIEVPETWNVSCLSLLLDSDHTYSQRQKYLESLPNEKDVTPKPSSLLKPRDRELFECLVTYRMLELNLDSTLSARVGWTPEKAMAPIGPLAVCKSCEYPRSVTIMGLNKKCGICLSTEHEELERYVNVRVSKGDNEATQATWVECCVQTCRAQYIVYGVEDLNVRAKCHYCRTQKKSSSSNKNQVGEAPYIECKECKNRVIWPETYRQPSFKKADFLCPPCTSGCKTVADVETTANKLSKENSLSWLICDSKSPDISPFTNRSLFHTISTIGTDDFLSRIKLFPPTTNPLTMKGKLIRNSPSLISALQDLISRRQTEKVHCSLCFSTFHATKLNPACGRRGCLQRICTDCLSGWYGLNGAGRIINTAALSCPFCRRLPSARTLAKYGMRIHSIGNLENAIQDKGTWVYVWCKDCATAKQYMERVCARGAPPDLQDWTCVECEEEQERERIALSRARAMEIEEAEARQRMIDAIDAIRVSRMKECPGCGTMTEKVGGCGHISCSVKHCGIDWCFFCGKSFSGAVIYQHMNKEHGNIYDGLEDVDMSDGQEW